MLLLGGGGAARSFTPRFAAQRTFPTHSLPASVTAADLNGDGKPDLIVANAGGTTVSVLLNTTAPGAATPSFATQQNFATGGVPTSVIAADVNGDGLPDLIVTNAAANTVSVLLNTTAPGATTFSFATQQTFATGTNPLSVTSADVNGDGLLDLIVANVNDNTVSVLLNTTTPGATTPSFATQQTFATGNAPYSVTAADVNGDGLPDLIVANNVSGTVSVLLNTTAPGAATPSFATQQTFAVGNDPSSVTVVDVNGDGKPDLIETNYIDDTVSVLLNTTAPGTATPSFATQQTFATGHNPRLVTSADVNADGKPDLIVANYASSTVSVLLNTTAPGATTPSFATQQTFATGHNPFSAAAADVNGDGKPDLIVVNANDNTVSVLLNSLYATTASGSPTTGTIHYAIPSTTILVPASLAMGSSPVGDTVTKNLTVKNTGTHPLYIQSVTSSDAEFAATGATTCPANGLAPLASCTIAIGFTPSAVGGHSATLSVHDNTANSPQHVALSGTGTIDMTVTPSSFSIGNTRFGVKVVKTVTVSNKQTNAVSLSRSISGPNATDFTVTGGTCGATLAAKTTCSIQVTFLPGALGSESATLAVADSPDAGSPYSVAFLVSGTIPETVAPLTLSYGTVSQSSSKALQTTVTNKSSLTISITSSISGANASDFSIIGGCGPTLAGNSSCPVVVLFKPTASGARSASLAVSVAQDPTSPHNVSLTGSGS
jgi:hypothetical protein